MARTGPFPRDAQWATLVAAIEDSLRLHRHQPGSLPCLAGYLHQRTAGMFGSLLWMIRSAAIQADIDGTEKITRTFMDAIPVDIASQDASPGKGKPSAPANGRARMRNCGTVAPNATAGVPIAVRERTRSGRSRARNIPSMAPWECPITSTDSTPISAVARNYYSPRLTTW